ncbi:Flp pilus assembly protein TadD [Azospirillum fermentarium]|uniref:tetratricopeptide repeat-containing glycosyltransferase family protein n=1 Tax=Azospirillum fermentarium TaxID=1233114 RepID=UPI002226581B|nr:tetratricopeptide repeat-containing glycosyltransferase family protein [Azospirillum fermentarium]MCW2249563.1 Flp pilus assembly protein TadD [Azospirillum fermentarium]
MPPAAPDPLNTPDFQAGLSAFSAGDLVSAEAAFRRVIRAFPDFAPARGNIGVVLRRLERMAEGQTMFHTALALDPAQGDIWSNLSSLEREQRDNAASEVAVRRALRCSPTHVPALCNLGNLLLDQAQFGEAATSYRRALQERPNQAEARKNLGLALLTLGDLREGYREYEWRNTAENLLDLKGDLKWPRWNGESLQGKTLVAVTEQGFGDVIHFARYGQLIEKLGGRMILTCQGPLVRLMRNAIGVSHVVGQGDPLPEADFWAPLMSLPLHFGTEIATIPAPVPYIRSEPELVEQWRAVLPPPVAGSPRVGIVWAGNPQHKNDHNRSLPLPLLDGLLQETGVRFVSLQRDMRPGDAEVLAARPDLIHVGQRLSTFADTAAILENLDMVISVDTSVVHLAGAMAKPVWALLPLVPDWRWMLGRHDSPWYPTLRLYRQPRLGDWGAVIAEVRAHLRAIVARRRPVLI